MATRAEMEAELEALREKLADNEIDKGGVVSSSKTAEIQEVDGSSTADLEAGPPVQMAKDDARAELDHLLKPLGVSSEEFDHLVAQFWKELDSLPQNKPLLTAIGAFGLGFILGRTTKTGG